MSQLQLLKLKLFFVLLLLILFSVVLLPRLTYAKEAHFLELNDKTEIEYTVYKANGDTLFLWLYSEAGPQQAEDAIVQQLVKKNIEVWRVDLFAAHFLPIASSSMDRIPDTDFSQLIEHAFQQTGKKIIPVTTGRGSLPILRGVRHWQANHKKSTALDQSALAGVILMSPKFYIETPEPGIKGKLLPIVQQSNLPLFILQPKKSPWYWKLDETIPALEKSGSDVFIQRISGVRDRYYFRADATDYEKQISNKLPATLKRAADYLKALPYKKRQAIISKDKKIKVKVGKKERKLTKYQGNPVPPELQLKDLNHKIVDLKKLKGKVVLVNFWASWCPPCVHEMPSMQRLQNRFSSKGFIILGVNMAEDEKTVQHFLNSKVNVQFPILFDKDGTALQRWGVFAFPTSYVIDKKGHIRFALIGGVDWETKAIINKISQLINE